MLFIDWFAGIGGFRRGMELSGHKCVGFCEFDKFAVASYTSMHLITEKQRDYLRTLDLKERQKEILKDEYRNGEWYSNDVRRVYSGDIPKADCWCFGFPCQDISVAGRQTGFKGNRSSLFFRIMRLIEDTEEKDRPRYLFIENVKNLLSVNRGFDFARLLVELDRGGYDAEWQALNSKDFGVPQSRKRLFIIGHLRGTRTEQIFPFRKVSENFIDGWQGDISGKGYHSQPDRVALDTGLIPCITKCRTATKAKVFLTQSKESNRLRCLTPLECFRAQGWEDEYFYKAAFVNSETALYEQAGNGVTVNVVNAIAERMI